MRVLHIGELMQLEVPAGLRVGAVALRQAVGLLFRHARYLGLIRIERSQRLGGRTLAGDTMEFRDHGFYLCQRFALTNFVATGAHALGKVEPELAMRTPLDLLAAEIAQYGAALLAVFQTGMQRAQVSRESGDMVEVVAGLLAQICASMPATTSTMSPLSRRTWARCIPVWKTASSAAPYCAISAARRSRGVLIASSGSTLPRAWAPVATKFVNANRWQR